MEVDKSSSEEIVDILARLICHLNGNELDFKNSTSLFESLGSEINKSLDSLKEKPIPICKGIDLPANDWNALDKFAKKMTADYMTRAEMIIRRLDVTIDSFFWSERIQQLEPQINQVYNPKRELISEWKPIGIEDVLAASDEVLIVEKASSYKQRISTKSEISNFLLHEKPKDRGGRTGEIIAPVRESFGEQHKNKEGGNFHRGRGNFHRGESRDEKNNDRGGRGRSYSGNQRGGHRTRPY